MSINCHVLTGLTMGKKNNFRKTWRTLTELGQEFGVSAVKFGNLLKQHGLREKDGESTQIASDGDSSRR